jgi:hypothetical protein
MRKRNKQPKASDIFRESNFLLGPKAPFSEVFPTVETIRIEIEQSGRGLGGALATYGSRKYILDSFHNHVDCASPLCYNGGVEIGLAVSKMVGDKQTDHEFSKSCQGLEDRRSRKPCMNRFAVKIHLKYKP